MEVVFDNIIFALQKHGGISVVWNELLKRAINDKNVNSSFIDFNGINLLRQELEIPSNSIIKNNLGKYPINIQRYINPKINNQKGIFHSSYYRTVNKLNINNITTVHDFTYEYFFHGLPKKIHQIQKGYAIKNSEKIICISQNTKIDLLKFYPKIKEDQVVVVYNGVSEDYFPIEKGLKYNLYEFIPFHAKEYILFVGDRSSEYKNFKMLVEACSIVNFPLVIVGGGSLNRNEHAYLEQNLGRNRYIQLSQISNEILNILYNYAAFFVYPSVYEGFGIPIIEAQKAGCPVISSNQSSIPEVAGNGAYLIKNISSEKIAEIIKENNSRSFQTKKNIELGILNSKRFSWDLFYNETLNVYSDVYSKF